MNTTGTTIGFPNSEPKSDGIERVAVRPRLELGTLALTELRSTIELAHRKLAGSQGVDPCTSDLESKGHADGEPKECGGFTEARTLYPS